MLAEAFTFACYFSGLSTSIRNFFKKDFIYLFMRDTEREREREAETQAEGEAGSMQGT